MRTLFAAAVVAALTLTAAPQAFASGVTLTPETEAAIRTKLTAEGYDVSKIKTEDGLYEAYVRTKDGKKQELFLDQTLTVVRTKTQN
ncbi:PepSY domain-containing protein [Novispirillum itersonii]|uniref:PepSY domain-containing protein n=1 Tax=Novispirillum itersonii TaxID=189 RepID=A0A7W9ZC30_NOVIT|nr:PepSY domain-containing protein [Novispirillum itersonii]MBB6208736.1 hypothetical protein [Novispirillum itersonii]